MKSGRIEQFAHLSEFQHVREFNKSLSFALDIHSHHFTKGGRMALNQLAQFSVKIVGVCNARICKLVQATQSTNGGISRSTFERMLRKANSLGILSIHHTVREKGGYSHSVYIFHRFETSEYSLNEHKDEQQPSPGMMKKLQDRSQTIVSKATNTMFNNPPKTTSDTVNLHDHTFVPTYVPGEFTKVVKPFFTRATEICKLWNQAQIAYRSARFAPDTPIDSLIETIIKAFKVTVYQYKKSRIKTTFAQYYYGTLAMLFTYEKRRANVIRTDWSWWLEKGITKKGVYTDNINR